MGRHWHLEHADGREWTHEELDGIAVRLREKTGFKPYDEICYMVCLDGCCNLWLIGDYGFYSLGNSDCKVVWDE